MSLEYRIGDVFERLAEIPDGSIDLIVTSPPFLALRSYLSADHPDKAKEIGSEATPAAFIDTLLALSAEWGRVLAPHGSLCVELGDTYSGSGNGPDAMKNGAGSHDLWLDPNVPKRRGIGWPLAKSLTGIPTLYPWSLAYGRNLLTGHPSVAGQWRIRNLIVWARPNPPVGALGDKFRPATSYITVACRGAKRYFDLDAVRTEAQVQMGRAVDGNNVKGGDDSSLRFDKRVDSNPAGAPPLDWHTDLEDGDWLWRMATQPYAGSHYATFPMALPKRLIEAMCPLRVCTVCGRPSERIVGEAEYAGKGNARADGQVSWMGGGGRSVAGLTNGTNEGLTRTAPTLGWSNCECPDEVEWLSVGGCFGHGLVSHKSTKWRTGVVLDPFAGSGTTLDAAQAVGRHAIGIDLDHRNADLARDRVGMFLEISA
jgi:site-specific DNA-methyltransferase (adenine-specific)